MTIKQASQLSGLDAKRQPVLQEDTADTHYLGQFIPLHYHHNMLKDDNRMSNFKAAIDQVVFDGAKVLELGGGTGVLSCFAAARASKVWCVEFNPALDNVWSLKKDDGCIKPVKIKILLQGLHGHDDGFGHKYRQRPERVTCCIFRLTIAQVLRYAHWKKAYAST